MSKYININIRKFIEKEVQSLWDKSVIIQKKNSKALKEAKKTLNRRLEGMNEIRKHLTDQANTFVTKDELRLVEKDIKNLSRLVNMGLGIWIVLQLILSAVLILIFKT